MRNHWRHAAVAGSVAAVLFLVAFDGGAFDLVSRSVLAVAVWWLLVLALALGFWPRERVPSAAVAAGVLLVAFALLTLLSGIWAAGAERAFLEFNRVALYLGVFLVGVLGSSRRSVSSWSDGLAAGLVLVTAVALVSRFAYGLFSQQGLPELLPGVHTRLSFPLGYWNGLAIFVALAVPLLLRAATTSSRPVVRGAAVAPMPALAAVIYLASSRGGAATAMIGAVVFLGLSRRRWAALFAVAIAAGGSLVYAWMLGRFHELVNGPLDSPAVREQGLNAAFLLLAVCAVSALLYGLLSAVRLPRAPAALGWAAAVVGGAVAALAVVAIEPRRRFAEFRRPPGEVHLEGDDLIRAHLLSAGGSGRWQFWEAGIEQFRTAPLLGRGAGSYESWWAQHGTESGFIVDAHSLYVETLGELGLVGLVLLSAALLVPVAAGIRRLLAMPPRQGEVLAAFVSVAAAFLVAAAVDWIWELTVVAALGMLVLGLLSGPATLPPSAARAAEAPPDGAAETPPRFGLGAAVLLGGWLAIVAAAAPLLREVKIRASQDAVARGEVREAYEHAATARAIEPWSAVPRLQIALVRERAGDLEGARAAIREAIDRDPENWRLWLVRARLETKAGAIADARASFDRARELNPRSPLFRP